MKSKNILASIVLTTVVNTAFALPAIASDQVALKKQAQANEITGVFGTLVQTINSPECTVKPAPIFT